MLAEVRYTLAYVYSGLLPMYCCHTIFQHILWATLKPGNRKLESGIGNRNPETKNRNPESTNQRKQVLQIRESYFE